MTAVTKKLDATVEFQSAVDAARIWQQKGTQLANLGKYTEALHYLNQALVIHPDNAAALVMRAIVSIHLERYEEALANCDRALTINPNDKQAWLFRGVALNYLGRYNQCYASYDKALGIERRSLWQKIAQAWKGIFSMSPAVTSSS